MAKVTKVSGLKTSVVMTTYNGERFLPEMLESLRTQTREIDELLILDDRSTDETVRLVREYIEKYNLDKWKIIINEVNIGWEKNFVKAMESATGDVIFPCDQDDIWHLDKIEKMTNAFENNEDIWLLVSGYHAFSENGGKMVTHQPVRTESDKTVSRVVFDEKYYQILRPGCTMAFKKDILPIFKEVWFPGTPHDAALWTIASLTRKLYLYNDTFIEYRRHDNNASLSISHGYKYKVNECERTKIINEWYLSSKYYNERYKSVIYECQVWCDYRIKLLTEKKLVYWFKLFRYRKYYLATKKYVGDLYYFMHRDAD